MGEPRGRLALSQRGQVLTLGSQKPANDRSVGDGPSGIYGVLVSSSPRVCASICHATRSYQRANLEPTPQRAQVKRLAWMIEAQPKGELSWSTPLEERREFPTGRVELRHRHSAGPDIAGLGLPGPLSLSCCLLDTPAPHSIHAFYSRCRSGSQSM